MKTVLIKRNIEKDGLPKKVGRYLVEYQNGDVQVNFYEPDYWDDMEKPDYWYEEVKLKQLIEELMPMGEEIVKAFPYNSDYRMDSPVNDRPAYIRQGIEWLKNKLTK